MKMKLCPCCDQPIQGIYCKGCRKIVLNPVEQNVTYYLNRRHPEFDHDCTYHEGEVRQSEEQMTFHEIEAKKEEIRARMAAKKNPLEPAVQVKKILNLRPVQNAEKKKRTALVSFFTILLSMFIIGFTFVMIIVMNIMNGLI